MEGRRVYWRQEKAINMDAGWGKAAWENNGVYEPTLSSHALYYHTHQGKKEICKRRILYNPMEKARLWLRCLVLCLPSPLLPLSLPWMKHAGLLFCLSSQHPQPDLTVHPSSGDQGAASAPVQTSILLLGGILTCTGCRPLHCIPAYYDVIAGSRGSNGWL